MNRQPFFKVSRCLGSFLSLLPLPFGCFDDESLFDCGCGNADITDFSVHHGLYALEIWQKTALGDGGHVRANTTALLGFTTAPDDTALHGAFACQFTNSCHISPDSMKRNEENTTQKRSCKSESGSFFSPDGAFQASNCSAPTGFPSKAHS